jgi:glycerol-3-phosphate cytidylyltransferase
MIIGITASCFDLLHAGHIAMLREAKKNCDYLICCLQADPTLDRPEKNKPVQSIVERYIQLHGTKYCDEIIPYQTEEDLWDILVINTIDIRFLGEEYKNQKYTGMELPIPIFYIPRQHRFSSTELRERMAYNEKD